MTISPLHVVTDPDRRGAQVFADAIGPAIAARGVTPRTVALGPGTRVNGLRVPVLGPRRLSGTGLRRLRTELDGSDVAVGFGSTTLVALTIAGLGADTPYVYRSIGETAYWANTWSRRTRVGAMMRRSAGIIALWSGAADDLCHRYGLDADRLHIVPRGVDADAFPEPASGSMSGLRESLGFDAERPLVCVVGSLSAEKNLGLAIDAVALDSEMQLAVAGAGPDRAVLEAHAEAAAPGRVKFLGPLESVVSVYQAADVTLLTSRSEGMPGVLIEAGLCGTPSVATAVGAVPEMISEGHSGFVVPRDASPSEVVDRLRAAIDGSSQLGGAMRQHCLAQYEIRVVADRWLSMLHAVRA